MCMFYAGKCSIRRYEYKVFPTSELASRCADSLQFTTVEIVMLGEGNGSKAKDDVHMHASSPYHPAVISCLSKVFNERQTFFSSMAWYEEIATSLEHCKNLPITVYFVTSML
jgi:hypothetical protein